MKMLLLAVCLISTSVQAEEICQVKICNKLSRFSLNPFSHMKDRFGETCFDGVVGKADAVAGKTLDSQSKWFQGSFNPTKKSVTYVKSVGECKEMVAK